MSDQNPHEPDGPDRTSPVPPVEPAGAESEGQEWWRAPAPTPTPGAPPRPAAPPPTSPPGPSDPGAAGSVDEGVGPPVGGEVRGTWREHGTEAVEAAVEIGAYIGDAVASRLPDPHAAAEQRGLDIRWLHLKVNIPAIVISLFGVWSGDSLADHMVRLMQSDGVLAGLLYPIGILLMVVLLALLLSVMPFGNPIALLLRALVKTVWPWLVAGVARMWTVRWGRWLLQLVMAVAAWTIAIAVLIIAGRGIIHLLTGV